MADQPPPPPPHGQNPRPPGGGLPDGNYDIFIIPPHSSGSGFLYLPSMQPHRNSFLLGVACTLFAVGIYTLAVPVVKSFLAGGGGLGVVLLVIAVGVGAWAWGKTQAESDANSRAGGTGGSGPSGQRQQSSQSGGARPNFQSAPPPPPPPHEGSGPKPRPSPNADAWEKAREDTRRREEERKRAEELRKKREEAQKAREAAEKAAKEKAEKDKWEQARAREKEQREREARERIARERLAREKDAREAKEKAAKENAEKEKAKAASERSSPTKPASPTKGYEKPSARSQTGTEAYSYRPYDTPKAATYKSSASSISGVSESSYAPSQSTARTTPPPSQRGPYSTNDPDKIQIRAVYLFSDSFPTKPISQLVSNQGPVTDGLILRIKTEGLFIDDDVRRVPQREWDVKAWTLKLVEDGMTKTPGGALHIFRATTRDAENKKYIFVLDETEGYKVAIGLGKLRKGSQVRSLGMNGLKETEVKGILMTLGWM